MSTDVTGTRLRSRHLFSDRRHGDFRPVSTKAQLAARRQALVALPWTWVVQVHQTDVVVVREPGQHAGTQADAIVCTVPGAAIGVRAGDCGLLLLEARDMVAVVHAGWRGLLAGVVENAVATMRAEGATDIHATLGPAIGPGCYAFGEEPMADMVAKYGERVRSETRDGHLALDMFEGIRAACEGAGTTFATTGVCTGCSDDHYSFRDPSKAGNQVVAAWLEH